VLSLNDGADPVTGKMASAVLADLLSEASRGPEGYGALLGTLQQLGNSIKAQQQLLENAQSLDTLRRLLAHREESVKLEACLMLSCLQVLPDLQQAHSPEPLVSALIGMLPGGTQPGDHSSTSTSKSSCKSGSRRSSRPSNGHDASQPEDPAALATWQAIPFLAAAAFLATAGPSSLEELCHDRPALVATLAQLAVHQVEGALHGAVVEQHQQAAGQQAAGPLQQQPWQLSAASAAMGGLLQVLCCGGQQVACAVVHQLCRLAHSTAVLDQLGVGLAGYPGAVSAVVALVQPWSQEGFREATSTATFSRSSSSSSHQWPGGAAQLQAEAVAAMVVLSCLGKGSKEIVAYEAQAVSGLLQALSDHMGPWPQQQQHTAAGVQLCSWFSLPCTNIPQVCDWVTNLVHLHFACCVQLVAFCLKLPWLCCGGGVWHTWCEVWCKYRKVWKDVLTPGGWSSLLGTLVSVWLGVCYELLMWVVGAPIVIVAEYCILLELRAMLPVARGQPWVKLRQQWAAYCLWHLLSSEPAGRSTLLHYGQLARATLPSLATSQPGVSVCTVMFAWHLAVQASLWSSDRVTAAAKLRTIEPPTLCHLLPTWQYRLERWALAAAHQAQSNLNNAWRATKWAVLLTAGGVCIWLTDYYLDIDVAPLAWPFVTPGTYLLYIVAVGVCWTGLLMSLSAAAALVVTASGKRLPYQVVVASRPAPAAAPPRTWLQPVSYLALDLSSMLSEEGASTSVFTYSVFGEWPAEAPFHPSTCAAQHVSSTGREWLSALQCTAWLYGALSVVACCLAWHKHNALACFMLIFVDVALSVHGWVCDALVASLQVCSLGMCVSAVMLGMCSAMLQPGQSPVHLLLAACVRFMVAVTLSAVSLITGLPTLLPYTCGMIAYSALSLLSITWWCTKACVRVVVRAVVCVVCGMLRLGLWLLLLPLRLALAMWSAVCAAGSLVCKAGASIGANRVYGSYAAQARPAADGSRPVDTCTTAATPTAARPRNHEAVQNAPELPLERQLPPSAAAAAAAVSSSSKGRRGKENRAKPQKAQQGKGQGAATSASGAGTSQGQPSAGGFPAAASLADATMRVPFSNVSSSSKGGGGNSHRAAAQDAASACATGCETPLSSEPANDQAAAGRRNKADGTWLSIPPSTQQPAPLESSTTLDAQLPAVGRDSSGSVSRGSNRQEQAVAVDCGSSSRSNNRHLSPPERSSSMPQQQEDALAVAQQAVQGAAMVAATAAMAAGRSPDDVLLVAAQAAAEVLQGVTAGLPFVEGSMLVVRAAAAAAAAAGVRLVSAAPDAMATALLVASNDFTPDSGPTGPAPGGAAVRHQAKAARPRRECVVCLDARPSVTTHPCGHRVLCGGCAALVAAGKGECPMCRAPVVRYEAC
jgi:hypothetical protein